MAELLEATAREEEAAREAPFHGDVLEAILSHVPTLDLMPASHVSSTWLTAVSSSLRRSPRLIPRLLLHLQSSLNPSKTTTTIAYDPLSQVWTILPHVPTVPHTCPLRPSHPGLLYVLSPSKLSISTDAVGSTWRDLDAPLVWRRDPVVAVVGSHVVVAGGTCEFEDDACAVETCSVAGSGSGRWDSCEPIPESFRGSTSATWLSVAVSDRKMYVMEKNTARISWFDPETRTWWGRTCELRPDPAIYLSAIGFTGDRLILIGATGESRDVESVRLWEVDLDTMEARKEIGRMPREMVERLTRGGDSDLTTIGFSAMVGGFGYVYNPSEPREIFLCEIGGDGRCRWETVPSPTEIERNPMHRVVFGCSTVVIDDLKLVLPPKA